ncbi:MAG: FG-GAP repeat protein [Candidatus Kerfeldbacteria bacterium]|nr:FG-GAP repeat protein [Candidatus Kerfeldbacteria bacterium]
MKAVLTSVIFGTLFSVNMQDCSPPDEEEPTPLGGEISMTEADGVFSHEDHAILPQEACFTDFDGGGRQDVWLMAGAQSGSDVGGAYMVEYGFLDENVALSTDATVSITPHTESMTQLACIGDVNGDGRGDIAVGILNEAAVYVFFGRDIEYGSHTTMTTANADVAIVQGNGTFGYNIAPAGDVTSDGIDDFLVGDSNADIEDESANVGAVWLIAGRASWSPNPELSSVVYTSYWGTTEEEYFGMYLEPAVGDLNGDSVHDVVMGSPRANGAGAVYVVFGPVSPGSYDADAAAGVTFFGTANEEVPGFDAKIGDFDCDGSTDMAIGAGDNQYGSNGHVSVFTSWSAETDARDAQTSVHIDKYLSLGDVNEDGCTDMLVVGELEEGYLLYGRTDLTGVLTEEDMSATFLNGDPDEVVRLGRVNADDGSVLWGLSDSAVYFQQ